MPAIANKKALIARRNAICSKIATRQRTGTLINVSCGTCGIASGAERILEVMKDEAAKVGLPEVDFIRSGCMTYCYAEPTVTITRPEMAPVTFGFVDEKRARKLVSDFIARGEPVEGEIPVGYERVVL